MHTMHSTLLIGHYDWEPERFPKEEFAERIDALWKKLPSDIAAIAVYGDRRSNAELVYLTNFVPKLRDALAILPRSGEPKMFVMGSPKMMPIAARQTWIKSPSPLGDVGKVLTQVKGEIKGSMVLVGGENLRLAQMKVVDEALGAQNASRQANEAVHTMMRAKRSKEVVAIRHASSMLNAMAQALAAAHKAGKGATVALTEAEHAAHKLGAMEVRSLLSFDGGKTLRPFMTPVERSVDPLQAYFAVRSNGYWAEGYVNVSKAQNPAADKAREALKSLVALAKPGARCAALARSASANSHPVTAGSAGNGIGLELEEDPRLTASSDAKLEAGQVLSLRVGVSEGASHAIVSAMVAITAGGHEVLWSAM